MCIYIYTHTSLEEKKSKQYSSAILPCTCAASGQVLSLSAKAKAYSSSLAHVGHAWK